MAASEESVTTLQQFVSDHALPATVEVAEGLYATTLDSDFSIGDVIRILPARNSPRLRRGQLPKEVEVVTRNGALRKTLPVDWPIFVRPITTGEDDFQHSMDLSEVCRKYGQGFPVLVETTEGTFHPKGTAVRIQKGVRLTIHYDVAVRTVLAGDETTKVAIRESYRGVFEKRPQMYPTVHDLHISEMDGKVRATKTVPVSHPDLDSVFVDDIIAPTDKKGKVPCDRQPSGHVEYLLCTREQRQESGRVKAEPIRIPLSMVCPFEEILEDKNQRSEFTLRELFGNERPELPTTIALVRGDPKFPDKTLAYMSTMTVEGMYDEIYVVASEYDNESPDKPIFEIPLHASLKVKHKVKLYTELDHRVKVRYYPIERLPEHIYFEKRTLVSAYEDIVAPPPVPPRSREGIRSASLSIAAEPEPMFPTEEVPPVPKHGSELKPNPATVQTRPRHASLPDNWLETPQVQDRGESSTQGLTHTLPPPKATKLHLKKGLKKLFKRVKEGREHPDPRNQPERALSPREDPGPNIATATGSGGTGEEQTQPPARVEKSPREERAEVRSYSPRSRAEEVDVEDPHEYEWMDSSDEEDYLTPLTSPTDPAMSLPTQLARTALSFPPDPAMSLPTPLMKTALSKQLSAVNTDSEGSYVTPVTSPTTAKAVEFSDDEDDSHDYIEMEEETEFGTVSALRQIPKPAPRHGHRADTAYQGQELTRTSTISTTSTDSGFSDPIPAEKTIPPKDYNIIDFSTQDMTRLLRYFHFSEDTIQSFQTRGITGPAVLKMTAQQLTEEFYVDDFQIKMLSHFVEKTKAINKLSIADDSDC
ncbi:uncharacterized protein [Branchiostoma lanceolatum]|uniref:uncharacterized protein n=1 Tax=Branchiostoma lanceolatum TaxID=7740 RepID=UPI003454F206